MFLADIPENGAWRDSTGRKLNSKVQSKQVQELPLIKTKGGGRKKKGKGRLFWLALKTQHIPTK